LGKPIVKYSTLIYRFLIILGTAFLALVLLVAYLDSISALTSRALIELFIHFGIFFVFSGIVCLTAGIVGIKRQYFENHFLSIYWIPLIASLIFVTFIFAYSTIASSTPMSPMMSEITQVTVVDTNPLVLSVGVKALTSIDTHIGGATILNSTNSKVAQIYDMKELPDGSFQGGSIQGGIWVELPYGSEIALTMNFNTTLPSGSYLVRLNSWGANQGSSLFTIP
jgi:hypothetical protein